MKALLKKILPQTVKNAMKAVYAEAARPLLLREARKISTDLSRQGLKKKRFCSSRLKRA